MQKPGNFNNKMRSMVKLQKRIKLFIPAMLIRSGDWKLINQMGSGGFSQPNRIKPGPGDPEGQLYNLADDPLETNNLHSKHPDIVTHLKSEIKQIVEK